MLRFEPVTPVDPSTPGSGGRAALDIAGLAGLAGYAFLAWYSHGTWREPELAGFLGAMAWVTLPAAVVFVLYRHRPDRLPVGRLLLWALLFRLAGLGGVPLFEDDWFRYLWDGYRFAETGTPYGWAPAQSFADPDVPPVFQRILDQINYPDLPTIYGPTTQFAFLLAYLVAPGNLLPLQLLLIGADLVLIRLLLTVAPARFVLLYAWCPLVIKEIAFTAHPDGFAVCLAFGALLLQLRGRGLAAAACLALAVGAKVFALVLVPFVLLAPRTARDGARQAVASRGAPGTPSVVLVFVATLALLYVPFVAQGGTDLAALAVFARVWEFNAALFAVISAFLPATPAKATLGLALLLGCLAYWRHWRQTAPLGGTPALPRADWLYGGLLLVSPVINPWYALWVLPFAAVYPSAWAWTAASALLLSYVTAANLGSLSLEPFAQPSWVRPLEFGLVAVAACTDLMRRRSP